MSHLPKYKLNGNNGDLLATNCALTALANNYFKTDMYKIIYGMQ